MQTIEKNTREWWEEIDRLADLLKTWNARREDRDIGKRVQESMERLGLIVKG
jgi:hypothetical protein